MTHYRVDFDSIEWQSPIIGVRHKVYNDGARVLRLVEYSQAMEPHWCGKGHIGRIIDGRFEIEFKSGTQIFEAGDGVFIPDGEEHSHRARALTDVVTAIFVADA